MVRRIDWVPNPTQNNAAGSILNKYSANLPPELIRDIKNLEAVNRKLIEEVEKNKKSEDVLETFLRPTTSLAVILDKNYNIVRVNEAFAKICSLNVSDFPGHSYFEFYPTFSKENFDKVIRTKETYTALSRPFTFPNHPEWGVTYWDFKLVPVLGLSGEVDLLVFTLNEVTENVAVKKKLSASEERYRTVLNSSWDGILLTTQEGSIISANPSACRMFGRTLGEMCALRISDIVDSNDPEIINKLKKYTTSEIMFIHKNRKKFPAEVSSNQFKDSYGNIINSMIFRDITKRKRYERRLLLTREKFYMAFKSSQAMMSIASLKDDNKIINVNNKFCEVLGYRRRELIGKDAINIWDSPQDRQDMLAKLSEKGYVNNLEIKFKCKSGEIIDVIASFNYTEINNEICIISSIIDITERKKTEEALRLSKELFNKAFDINPLPMIVALKKDGICLEINKSYVEKFGYTKEELNELRANGMDIGQNIDARKHFVNQIDENGVCNNYELSFKKKNGDMGDALVSGVSVNWYGEDCYLEILNDITELRRCQSEIARLERLNLIGEMAAGIGHEIRNRMTTVRGFIQLLKRKDRYTQDKEYMSLMLEELDRANSVITLYISLAKDKAVDLKKKSLNQVIIDIYSLLQAEALKQDKNIKIELEDIPEILIDEDEIYQLILNLARNGMDAMSAGEYLSIKTYEEGNEVVLAMQDQGKGIPSDLWGKLGTPFFTTKDYGTGLGLAVCYSIAQRHKAKIDFETGPTGTTFYVRFAN